MWRDKHPWRRILECTLFIVVGAIANLVIVELAWQGTGLNYYSQFGMTLFLTVQLRDLKLAMPVIVFLGTGIVFFVPESTRHIWLGIYILVACTSLIYAFGATYLIKSIIKLIRGLASSKDKTPKLNISKQPG